LAGALPQTPLALPKTPNWIQGVLLLKGGRREGGKREGEEQKRRKRGEKEKGKKMAENGKGKKV